MPIMKKTIPSLISIATLSAIMVFSCLTSCANSNNPSSSNIKEQITKYNTALSLEQSKPDTMYDALQILIKNGYQVSEVKSNIENSEILWDSINNAFCFYNGEKIEYYPESTYVTQNVSESDYWSIVDVLTNTPTARFNKDWSIYIRASSESDISVSTGVDVGSCSTISNILYKAPSYDSRKTVTIRTNSTVNKLTINAAKDTVNHYNKVGSVEIIDVGNNSYHEFAKVNRDFEIHSGRAVIEPSGDVVKGRITIDVSEDKNVRLDYRNETRGYALLDKNGGHIVINNEGSSNIKGYIIDETGKELGPIGYCEHVYSKEGHVVDPTCTEDGYTEFYCIKCNAVKKDNIVPALGHDFSGPFFIDEDKGHCHTCKVCGEHEEQLHAHIYRIARASETEDKVCTECGYVAEKATGHQCKNHLIKVDQKAAICTEYGNIEYYRCSDNSCGKNYFDSEAKNQILDINDIIIKPLGHDFSKEYQHDEVTHWHKCSRCEETSTHVGHSFEIEHATETQDKICTVCGYVAEQKTGHICKDHLTKIDANAPTCVNAGNVEYYQCSCGKYYRDSNAVEIITDLNTIVISPLGHDFVKDFSYDENNHWHKCSRCNETTSHVAHAFAIEHASETEDKICTECGYVAEQKTGHQCKNHLIHVNRNEPTCTASGNIEYYRCGDASCGKNYFDSEATQLVTDISTLVLDALGHDFEEAYQHNELYHWHNCSRCDQTSTPAAHTFNIGHATETEDKVCTACGYVAEQKTGHQCKNHLSHVDAKSPTCTEKGNVEYYRCSCGKCYKDKNAIQLVADESSLSIDALGHDYNRVVTSEPHTTPTNLSPKGASYLECSRCHDIKDRTETTSPSYWEDNLVSGIKPDSNNFNFIYTSDPHFDVDNAAATSNYYNYSTNLGLEIKRTAEYAGIDTVLVTGDNSTSASKPEAKMRSSLQFSKDIYSTQLNGLNVLTTRGNHDGCYGTSYSTQMKPSEVNSLISPHVSVSGTKLNSGEDGSYYYVDYPTDKVRIISLNAYFVTDSDYDFKNQDIGRFGKQQLTWLINNALKFDESGWSIILMTHTVNQFKGPVAEVRDQNVLFGILNAYYSQSSFTGSLTNADVGTTYNYDNLTADFTKATNRADIIGLFSGHCHMDNVNTTLAPFPVFSIVSATNECKQMGADGWVHSVGEYPNRVKFTKTETAFDIVSVDLTNKAIKLTRVGDGNGSVRNASYHSSIDKKEYSISANIPANINYSSPYSSITEGGTFTAKVSPKSYKYNIGTVTVKMGESTVSGAYNSATGDITVSNVSDNITITVTEVSANKFVLYQAGMKFSSSGHTNKAGQELTELTNIKLGFTGNNIAGPFEIKIGDVIHLENMRMGKFTGCPDNGAMSIAISSSNIEYYLGATKGYIQCSSTFTFSSTLAAIPGLRLIYEYDTNGLLSTITVTEYPSNVTLYMYLGYFSAPSGDAAVYITHAA